MWQRLESLLPLVPFLWIGGMSLVDYILFGVDKARAVKKEWRIPEATLWLFALLGGGLGGYLGMQKFRHKTKHKHFQFGIPALMLLQLGGALWIFFTI